MFSASWRVGRLLCAFQGVSMMTNDTTERLGVGFGLQWYPNSSPTAQNTKKASRRPILVTTPPTSAQIIKKITKNMKKSSSKIDVLWINDTPEHFL